MTAKYRAMLLAGTSILLWSAFASLGRLLAHVPPLLLVALALGFGSLPGLRAWRSWAAQPRALVGGALGLFSYHLLLFVALRLAPAVEANLLNYLWPALIVVFSSLLLPGYRLTRAHIASCFLAGSGAVLVIGQGNFAFRGVYTKGYLCAVAAAVVWALYSVEASRRPEQSSTAVGGYCFVAALLALAAHGVLEPAASLSLRDGLLIALLGLGPMGIAFYTWDSALKQGDPRSIAALSYATPLLSTWLLTWTIDGFSSAGLWTPRLASAFVLIVGGSGLVPLLKAWQGRRPSGHGSRGDV